MKTPDPPNHDQRPDQPCPDYLCIDRIAQIIGRSSTAVTDKIARLGIRPAVTASEGRYRWFHPEVAEQIRAAMRKPNRPKA
jgi:hypothetical protein